MNKAELLDKQIDEQRKIFRTDKVDITWGQIATMYEEGELRIHPEFQRLYRWTLEQKSRFIESILLGLPLPALFVAEDEDGIWELVDGLQRVSTVLEFMGLLKDPDGTLREPFRASFSTEARLSELDGCTFKDLSLSARLSIKRASCRVEVIKVGSSPDIKFEVFERLNTGGAKLTDQEIRNCMFRAINPKFAQWIDEMAEYPHFKHTLNLSDQQEKTLYDRALVLRFFTLKNWYEEFKHDVEPFITRCFKEVLLGKREFSLKNEEEVFQKTFKLIDDALNGDAYRHIRDGKPQGAFSVYLFEGLSVGVAMNLELLESLSIEEVRERLNRIKNSSEFLSNTGAGANTSKKLKARIEIARDIIRS